MRVKALKGFAGMVDGKTVSHAAGDEFELPAGADWVRAGLVAAVGEQPAEDAPAEEVAKPSRSGKRAKHEGN